MAAEYRFWPGVSALLASALGRLNLRKVMPAANSTRKKLPQQKAERHTELSSGWTVDRSAVAAAEDARESRDSATRFKNNAFDLVVDGESYRSRLKPNIEKLPPPPSAPVKKVPVHSRRKAAARRR